MSFFKTSALDELEAKRPKQDKKCVLIVDDEEDNLLVLQGILERHYEVLTARDGAEALETIKNDPNPSRVCVIITDQRMPKVTGIELLEQSIPILPQAIKMILTAYTDLDVIIDGINKGHIYQFITKPFDPNDILLTVKRAIETYDLEKENGRLVDELQVANEKLQGINADLEDKVQLRTKNLEDALKKQEHLNRLVTEANEKLTRLATTDSLTGIFNRGYYFESIKKYLEGLPIGADRGIMLMLDIDHFKQINDRYGHPIGDETLTSIAGVLRKTVNKMDIVGRLGGEEFGIYLQNSDKQSSIDKANLIREQVQNLKIRKGETTFGVTVSIGLSEVKSTDSSLSDVLKRADVALYLSKKKGRNCVTFYTPDEI